MSRMTRPRSSTRTTANSTSCRQSPASASSSAICSRAATALIRRSVSTRSPSRRWSSWISGFPPGFPLTRHACRVFYVPPLDAKGGTFSLHRAVESGCGCWHFGKAWVLLTTGLLVWRIAPCLLVNRPDMEKEPAPCRSGAGSFFPSFVSVSAMKSSLR